LSKEAAARWLTGLDVVAVALLLPLTIALASFAVRNSDFWSHLGTGRLIAQGKYQFGHDPFAYTTEGVYWANHSWLYDLVLYEVYEHLGGPAIVILKAALLTLLTLVLLSIRVPGQRLGWPVCCVCLAVLAMTPRFLLQPAVLSFLLLGVTVWLLLAPRDDETPDRRAPWYRSRLRWWLLPVVFWLWVNLDGWFLLGPITLALFVLGAVLSNWLAGSRNDPLPFAWNDVRRLALIFGLGFFATLLSFHHVRAYTLPFEVSPTVVAGLKNSVIYRGYFLSPFDSDFFGNVTTQGAASQAYFALALLGVASFVTCGKRQPVELILPCAALFALSCWSARCIPFFAVVMAPVAALNLQRWQASQWGADNEYKLRSMMFAGRFGLVAALLVLLALSWPGWLSPGTNDPNSARHVEWKVTPEPSLEQAALQLHDWHQQGRLPEASRGFIGSLELANYCAWYCPEERVFCDSRWQLYSAAVLQDYLELVNRLQRLQESGARSRDQNVVSQLASSEDDVRQLLRRHHVTRVADYARRPTTMAGEIMTMLELERTNREAYDALAIRLLPKVPWDWRIFWSNPKEWPMLYFDGRTIICAWNDPNAPADTAQPWWKELVLDDPAHGEHSRLFAEAFGSGAVRAPETGTVWPRERMTDWEKYARPPAVRPFDADEARGILEYGYGLEGQFRRHEIERIAALSRTARIASVVGFEFGLRTGPARLGFLHNQLDVLALGREPTGKNAPAEPPARLWWIAEMWNLPFDQGSLPSFVPYLAIRHARLAVQASPYDPNGYFALADAYFLLSRKTAERNWIAANPLLAAARRTQRIAALQQALMLDDTDPDTHKALANEVYLNGFPDTALAHLEKMLEGMRRQADDRKTSREQLDKEIESLQKNVDTMRETVDRTRGQFLQDTKGLPIRKRAELALTKYHLPEEALNVLAEAKLDDFKGSAEIEELHRLIDMKVDILLDLGRINDDFVIMTLTETGPSGGDDKTQGWKDSPFFRFRYHAFRRAMALGNYREADELLVQMQQMEEAKALAIAFAPIPMGGDASMSAMAKYGGGIPASDDPALDCGHVLSVILARMLLDAPFTPRPFAYEALLRQTELLHTLGRTFTTREKAGIAVRELGGNLSYVGRVFVLRAEMAALRGLVALEAGDMARARKLFQWVIEISYPEGDRAAAVGDWAMPTLDSLGRRIAVYWLRDFAAMDRKP
jgi:hypothetical protein